MHASRGEMLQYCMSVVRRGGGAAATHVWLGGRGGDAVNPQDKKWQGWLTIFPASFLTLLVGSWKKRSQMAIRMLQSPQKWTNCQVLRSQITKPWGCYKGCKLEDQPYSTTYSMPSQLLNYVIWLSIVCELRKLYFFYKPLLSWINETITWH